MAQSNGLVVRELPLGATYTIEITSPGFEVYKRTDLFLRHNEDLHVITMQGQKGVPMSTFAEGVRETFL